LYGHFYRGHKQFPDSHFSTFDKTTMMTLQCRVRSVGSFRPEKNATSGLRLKVETPAGETYTVFAGPQHYYMLQSMRFRSDDMITVTGSKTKLDNKTVIMASKIQKSDETFDLRDPDGKPLWKIEMASEK
jgi:hypothetical protein